MNPMNHLDVMDTVRLNFNPASLMLLNVVLAFLMFGVALDTRKADFMRVFKMPVAFACAILAQFVILPAITFALTLLLNVRPSIALGMILVACCPPGNVSNILTHRAKGNVALSVSMTAVSNALSIFLMPLNFALWAGMHPTAGALFKSISINPLEMLIHIVAIIGVPFVLGIWVAQRWPAFTARFKKPIGTISFVTLGIFIIAAIAGNWKYFITYTGVVILAVAIHDALAFGTGYVCARLFKLSDYDRRAMSIEVGIRNAGLGLVLIFTFFGGLGGMAIVAGVWGWWDIVAGLALATLWGRNPPVVPDNVETTA